MMKTFIESLNEGKVSIDKMNFQFTVYVDGQGLALEFTPDPKTAKLSVNEQVDSIKSHLNKKMPEFGKAFWFQAGRPNTPLMFRVDTAGLADMIEKALK